MQTCSLLDQSVWGGNAIQLVLAISANYQRDWERNPMISPVQSCQRAGALQLVLGKEIHHRRENASEKSIFFRRLGSLQCGDTLLTRPRNFCKSPSREHVLRKSTIHRNQSTHMRWYLTARVGNFCWSPSREHIWDFRRSHRLSRF